MLPIFLFLKASDENLPALIIISRIAGIYAFVWYSLQFLISARNKLMEWFVAQDKRIMLHMVSAVALLMIVVVHTGFGNKKYVNEIQAAAGGTADTIFLWATLFSALFFTNYFIRFLPVIIPFRDKISAFFKLTYERCRLFHYTMPIGMAILICHIILLPGQELAVFKTCMTLLGCSALLVFLFHRIVVPIWMQKNPWTVAEVIPESSSVVTLYFDPPPGKKIKHKAGQFCYFHFLGSKFSGQFHPFTISSAPGAERLSITVKQLGDFTAGLKKAGDNALVSIDGAYGDFSYTRVPLHHSLIFIAGGIGITPMLSMLKELSIISPKRKVILVWGVRRETDLIRLLEIKNLSKQMNNFIFEPVLSRSPHWKGHKGHIDKPLLTRVMEQDNCDLDIFKGSSDCQFFICGPPSMTASVVKLLRKENIPSRRIHTENFAF